MLAPATTTATRLGALGLQLQVTIARGASTTLPYSSLASSLSLVQRQCAPARCSRSISTATASKARPWSGSRRAPRAQSRPQSPLVVSRRHASTAAPAPAGADISSSGLDWNAFFTLRKTRRRFQVVSSLFTMAVGGTGGAMLLVNVDMDWLLNRVPMDPFFALGIITLSFSGLGWLAGPSLGSSLFYLFKRGVKKPMAVKESEFFARIKKHRVDPSNSSLSGNAVPDFYGEKISSVAGYRQWLKDQRAFNKKRTSFV
ncbi:Pam17-domain-containing protein [Durotheca rogersii]|uniref:Pam17-domain-containing protein n=1 Tax=Durotheca rogersii TaxID=419775 RepID=UPI00221FABB3|nr:Pam17-domain-containing protein [Durotheca rogersii]KAI5867096.1 Pam17-domain-containing protein [Durotheca rogersii]